MALQMLTQLALNGILLGGVYALMSLGINLVFGVMRVINFSHGDLIMVGGFITFSLFARAGVSPFLALPVSAAVAFAVGILVQRFLLRRLPSDREAAAKASLLITFGVSYVVVNAAQLIWSNEFQTVSAVDGAWPFFGLQLAKTRTLGFLTAGLITALVWFFLKYSNLGRGVRAISQHVDGATVCGIDVSKLRLFTFGLGSALAGAAGAIYVMIYPVQPALGANLTLKSFAIAAIGGLGSYPGALLGAVILGIAEVFSGAYISVQAAGGVAYFLFLLVLLLRPAGLLGVREI